MSSGERHNVAQELAAKDGHGWERLSAEQVNAYLHNADLVIEERDRPPVDELNPQPAYTCPSCQDKAYIGGKRCLECNPMGLPAEEVHPALSTDEILTSVKDDSTEIVKTGGDPPAKAKLEAEAEENRKTRPLKPGEYRCSKCSKPGKAVIHRKTSKEGKSHIEFKVLGG